jgi:hypothetical protein
MLQIKPPTGKPVNITGIKAIKPVKTAVTCGTAAPDQLDKPPC